MGFGNMGFGKKEGMGGAEPVSTDAEDKPVIPPMGDTREPAPEQAPADTAGPGLTIPGGMFEGTEFTPGSTFTAKVTFTVGDLDGVPQLTPVSVTDVAAEGSEDDAAEEAMLGFKRPKKPSKPAPPVSASDLED